MFGNWVRQYFIIFQQQTTITRRTFCNLVPKNNNKAQQHLESYRDLENLDFTKAAKILFSTPTKKKKFGLDFHLVQLFFALMPSLAVYLVAQYARYEIRVMEAELEVKRKAEEEQKAKEMEAAAEEEKEVEAANPELLKVKERLEALEETVKGIVVESKSTKQTSESIKNVNTDQNQKTVDPIVDIAKKTNHRSKIAEDEKEK